MPELPEVETVRVGLASIIAGGVVRDVTVHRSSCVRLLPGGPAEFRALLTGARIGAVARRGKFLWMPLTYGETSGADAPVDALSAHLGMSGQFRVHDGHGADAPDPHPHCRARLDLDIGGRALTLDFLDQRTFGYLHVEPLEPTADALAGGQGSDVLAVPVSVAHIGRDVLDPALDADAVTAGWRRGRRGIKQVLLDQTLVSGIGNIYADEALWLARVHPEQGASSLSKATALRLLEATRMVMASALAQGGTSFDALYVNVNGESGYFSRSLEAYGRGGEPCRRCGRLLSRASIGGRSTHWCGSCQRRPSAPSST